MSEPRKVADDPQWHPTPTLGDFGLIRGGGLAMFLVRLGTLSRWGHACIAVGEPEHGRISIVEALPGGIRLGETPVELWTWSNVQLSEAQRATVVGTALGEVDKPYDWPSIAGFVLRRFWAKIRTESPDHPDSRLFCSELVAWSYREAGCDLFPGFAPNTISPGDLAEYLVKH